MRPLLSAALLCANILNTVQAEEEVRIGYAQAIELSRQSPILKETLKYLEKSVPGHHFELIPLSPVDTIEEIQKDHIEFLIAPSNYFVELSGHLPFTHLVTRIYDGAKEPDKTVGSTIIVRSDRKDLRELRDLKDKKCVASLPDSVGGWLAALGEIKEHGFDPDNFFKKVTFTQYQTPDVIGAVLSGSADAGVLTNCVLEEALASGLIEKNSLRVINRQPTNGGPLSCLRSTRQLYSDISIAALKGVPEPLSRELTVALLSMPPIDNTRWSLQNDQYSIRRLLQELRLGPYSYLRDNSLGALFSRFRNEILVVFGILLLLLFNEVNLRRLVKKRTGELSRALIEKEEANKIAAEERKKFANLEKNGIISQLGTIIAHEAKQPIGTLTNYLQVLKIYVARNQSKDEFANDVLQNMEEQIVRLDGLVNSVRNFAKRKQNPQVKSDLNLITQKALYNLKATEPETDKIHLRFEPLKKPAWVLADPLSLELLILNLLRNAAQEAISNTKGEPAAVLVNISVSSDPKRYLLSVKNTGRLMSEEDMSRLISLGESVKPEGLGLGLSIIRGIADHHGADLKFMRRNKGGVTAFLVIDRFKEE